MARIKSVVQDILFIREKLKRITPGKSSLAGKAAKLFCLNKTHFPNFRPNNGQQPTKTSVVKMVSSQEREHMSYLCAVFDALVFLLHFYNDQEVQRKAKPTQDQTVSGQADFPEGNGTERL